MPRKADASCPRLAHKARSPMVCRKASDEACAEQVEVQWPLAMAQCKVCIGAVVLLGVMRMKPWPTLPLQSAMKPPRSNGSSLLAVRNHIHKPIFV